MSRSRRLMAVAGLVTAGILLAGCGGSGSSDAMGDGAMSADMAMTAEMPMAEGAPMDTKTVADRSVIRTAWLWLRVDAVDTAVAEVRALTASAKGVIVSETVAGTEGNASATLTVQVPADGLDSFLEDVSALGSVDSLEVTASDVTMQVIDLDARITVLEDSIARLTELLAEAQQVADIVAIEAELSARQAELDSLNSQRAYLANQVAMSTVTVSLLPVTVVSDIELPGFLSGLETGWSAFLTLIAFGITALGFLVPFLIVAALIAVPLVIVLVRRSRRRRRVQGWDDSGAGSRDAGSSSSPSASSPSSS